MAVLTKAAKDPGKSLDIVLEGFGLRFTESGETFGLWLS
jgi:hypothetical protein